MSCVYSESQWYSIIVLYSREHKCLSVAHENITLKPALLFPDNDDTVLVR